MKPLATKKINVYALASWLMVSCAIWVAPPADAQFQIVGMQTLQPSGWAPVTSSQLTIVVPEQPPFTGQVALDYQKQYPSGTTFTTYDNTSISVFHKGQTQILHPNSTLKVIQENNGIKAQTLKGTVQHVLEDVKQKVGFYRAGNGYTWAHAEGTDFTVEASSKSQKVKITTNEGRVVVTDQVPVRINEQAASKGAGRKARELSTVIRTSNGAGQQYETGQKYEDIEYATYGEAIAAFEAYTNDLEESDIAYYDELADNFALIGELYLDLGEYDRAQIPLAKAYDYVELLDPEDMYLIDIMLYLAEAMIYGSDQDIRNEGIQMTRDFIDIGEEAMNETRAEYEYARKMEDADWEWDVTFDLVNINEYMGWAHALLEDPDTANHYYHLADDYSKQL